MLINGDLSLTDTNTLYTFHLDERILLTKDSTLHS